MPPTRPARLTLLGLLLTAVLAGAPPARADCGGVRRAGPATWHHPYRPPLAVGDSTMLLALPALAREGFSVDAHGCRQFAEALQLLRRLAAGGILPHLTVIALGADGTITRRDLQSTVAILGPRRALVLVTPLELGGSAGADAATVRGEARRHPDRVHLLDWVRYSAGHGDWFQPDHLHLTFAGADAFARLLRQALPLSPPPARLAPPPSPPTRMLMPTGAALGGPDEFVLAPAP